MSEEKWKEKERARLQHLYDNTVLTLSERVREQKVEQERVDQLELKAKFQKINEIHSRNMIFLEEQIVELQEQQKSIVGQIEKAQVWWQEQLKDIIPAMTNKLDIHAMCEKLGREMNEVAPLAQEILKQLIDVANKKAYQRKGGVLDLGSGVEVEKEIVIPSRAKLYVPGER